MEYSYKEVVFLDTIVRRDPNKGNLYTSLYQKPTDTHAYLHYTSAHPQHCKSKGPYGQFLRLRRICSLNGDYFIEANKMIKHYVNRGYPEKNLRAFSDKAAKFKQIDLLNTVNKNKVTRPIMVTQFNPLNPDIRKWLRENWSRLLTTNDLKEIFRERPMVAYKKLPTLSTLLTNAKVQYPSIEPPKQTRPKVCTKAPSKCKYCRLLSKDDNTYCTKRQLCFTNLKVPTRPYLTCKICNVIYCITCKKCKKQYIGQSSREIWHRMYEHQYSVRTLKDTPVSKHFRSKDHSASDMAFSLVEWINKDPKFSDSLRLQRENYWIWTFKSLYPHGLNQMM